jgi:DNA polymerase-3 subunit epsilon
VRLNQVTLLIKQLSDKIGSNIYASVQDQTNLQQVSFLRQLQKDIHAVDYLDGPLDQLNVVIFDIETTGFQPDRGDYILSIGAVKATGTVVQDHQTFHSFIHSDRSISPAISELTRITAEDLLSAPSLSQVLTQFYEFINGHVLVAHHANHEKSFMQHATWSLTRSHFQQRIIDTSFLIRMVHPSLNLVRLEDCCKHCGIDVVNRHHALGDAKMTAHLWSHYLQKIQEMGYGTLREVYEHIAR